MGPNVREQCVLRVLLTACWLVFGLAFVALITEPVSVRTQFVFGMSTWALMLLIRALRLQGVWRHVFLALGSAMVMRYLFWRTANTLPPISDPLDFVPGVLLYVAELYSMAMLAISLFVIADPLERPPPPALADDDLPSVDVFIPTYNEDPELLAMTVVGAINLDYPADKLRVHVLDDGGTDQKCNQSDPKKAQEARERRAALQALAAELGAIYLTRARNEHAKAGNMNNALGQTAGEIIVVFDADHVPMRQFLRETVGYFRQDPKLFLCQTPHIFSNPDPLERNLQTFGRMPSENEMFYGIIQKGLDKWNGAFFCGSAALVRRKALDEVGGFSGITITEDCETALDLHSRGWTSCYVDKPMISGLQPETFASFIGQRSRWARGMFQIFLLKNPLFKRGLSASQKICYLSNMTFWFFPLFRLPFFVAPLLYIWFSMQIYVANMQEFLAYTMLYMITNMLMQSYLYGPVRWTWISELYEFVQSLYLSRGLISVVLNPRKPTFNVTDKGHSLDEDHISELAKPYFILYGVFAVSMIYCGLRWLTEPDANELLGVVAMWNFFNLIISGVSLGVVAERRAFRIEVDRAAELAIGSVLAPARIVDVAYGGCAVAVSGASLVQPLREGAAAVLNVPLSRKARSSQTLPVFVANWSQAGSDIKIAFRFGALKRRHYEAIHEIMYPTAAELDAQREKRRVRRGILVNVAMFVRWAVTEPLRGFRLAFAAWRKARQAEAAAAAAAAAAALAAASGPEARPAGSERAVERSGTAR